MTTSTTDRLDNLPAQTATILEAVNRIKQDTSRMTYMQLVAAANLDSPPKHTTGFIDCP
jgi:hypothetical protein